MATTTLLLLGLAALKGTFFWCVNAQQAANATIALLPEFSGLSISGQVVGTGADGTTYVLSASGTSAGDIPFTMTVVQDASHVSEAVSLAMGLGADVQCAYDSQGAGACTLVTEGTGTDASGDAGPQTTVISTSLSLVAVPVTTASSTSTQLSASGSATSSGSTDSSSSTSGTVHTFALSLSAVFSIILATIATA
ncbi:hypothetical protein ACEPAF_7984 [Sanghuangporus sanghuang]